MWHDQPFSQRNMTTDKTVGAGVGGDREVGMGVCGQNFKEGCRGRQYREGVSIK